MMEINFKQQRWHLSNRMSDELAYIISYFTLFLSCPGQWPVLDGNGLIDHHRIYLQVAVPVGKWTQTHTKIVSVTCHLRFNKCYVCTWFCVFHSVALALLRWGAPLHGQHLCVCVDLRGLLGHCPSDSEAWFRWVIHLWSHATLVDRWR